MGAPIGNTNARGKHKRGVPGGEKTNRALKRYKSLMVNAKRNRAKRFVAEMNRTMGIKSSAWSKKWLMG